MEEVVYEDIQYNGKAGSLMLTDDLFHYKAYPPYKSAVRCSLALLLKRQVSPKSASRQYIKLLTRSGKEATFYVEDRDVLEEIREDLRSRIEQMRQRRMKQKQMQEQQQSSQRSINPMQQLISLLSPANSSSAQRFLQEGDDNAVEVQQLQRKYARQIQQDPTITAMNQQIQEFKAKIQQQQAQKKQMRKEAVLMQQEQNNLNELERQLQILLHEIKHVHTNDDDSSVDVSMRGSRRGTSKNKKIQQRRDYTKAIQKVTAGNMKAAPPSLKHTNGGKDKKTDRKAKIEALELETYILQTMHRQMALQNQSSLAQKHFLIVKSLLARYKTHLDNGHAQDMQFTMMLDGTQNALTNMYPDIVLRQEYMIDKLTKKERPEPTKKNGLAVPPLILSPQAMKMKTQKRSSVTKSDGISELGESLRGKKNRARAPPKEYHPPAVMTSVASLQHHSLTQLAGVEK